MRAILLLTLLLNGAAASAQNLKGLPASLALLPPLANAWFRLRETDAIRNLEEAHADAIRAETARIRRLRLENSVFTAENPLRIDADWLWKDLNESLAACPAEIRRLIESRDIPKKPEISPDTNPAELAACAYRMGSIWVNFLRWNGLRTKENIADGDPHLRGVQRVSPVIRARDENGVRVLTVISHLQEDLARKMQQVIDRYWNGDGLRIEIERTHNRGEKFRMFEVKGATPSAIGDRGKPYSMIRLDPRVDADEILAHEFGHILGFFDCYIDLWDEAAQTQTYYELDRTNLMCSLAGQVLPEHREALIKAYVPVK